MRITPSAMLCSLALTIGAQAQTVEPPATIASAGGGAPLQRAAHASRVYLLGQAEMYTLAIYVEAPPLDRVRLAGRDVTKTLRIQITYKEDLRGRYPVDWRRELLPPLEETAEAHLFGSFAPLRHGDVVLVEYAPGRGTSVRINNRSVAASSASHDLMLAFLDHWIGQRPVSEELKRALLGGA